MGSDPEEHTTQIGFAMSKDYLFLIPLLGTALAIIYDVGYFDGIDLYFFSFFPLANISYLRFKLCRALCFCRASLFYTSLWFDLTSRPPSKAIGVLGRLKFFICC